MQNDTNQVEQQQANPIDSISETQNLVETEQSKTQKMVEGNNIPSLNQVNDLSQTQNQVSTLKDIKSESFLKDSQSAQMIYGSNGLFDKTAESNMNMKEKYNDFIESSDVLIEFYKHQQTFGLEKYFIEIEEWLNTEIDHDSENLPLVIEAEEGVGKKTLLVKWIQHHQNSVKQDFEDIIITHFASAGGNNSNSFYAIYRILIKLRESFNINQKVELLEEKIRKNFNYWLELCSQKADSSVVYDGKVVLIIEGLESFKDFDTRSESNIKFWLPKTFPKNIKVITTAAKGSKSYKYLKNIGCKIIELRSDPSMLANKITSLETRDFFCLEAHKEKIFTIIKSKIENKDISSLFMKIAISCLCPYASSGIIKSNEINKQQIQNILSAIDYKRVESCSTTEDLIQYILEYFEDRIIDSEKFKMLFCAMSLTFKGLKVTEILDICGISFDEWKLIISFSKPFFFSFKGFWKVGNDIVLRSIEKKYFQDGDYMIKMHMRIADVMSKGILSIRSLEELTNHYFKAKDYFSLKQTIASIETFLLLFNPYTKYDLCRYWQELEGKGYDPVVEYNKGLELFDMHFSPKPEDLFTIILQISRFLKEFSDFETKNTPKFRHPFIKGKIIKKKSKSSEESEELSWFQNKELLSDVVDPNAVAKEQAEQEAKQNKYKNIEEEKFDVLAFLKANSREANQFIIDQEENSKLISKMPFKDEYTLEDELEKKKQKEAERDNMMSFLDNIGLEDEIKIMRMMEFVEDKNGKIIENVPVKGHENCNVDVPSGRKVFIEEFREQLKKMRSRKKLTEEDTLDPCFYIEESNNQKDGFKDNMDMIEMSNNEEAIKVLEPMQKLINEIDLNIDHEIPPSFYYYKRWIWMTFPWACLQTDQRFSFSKLINQCYSSNLRYLSVQEDKLLTTHAIKIVRETKAKRKAMIFAKTEFIKQPPPSKRKKMMQNSSSRHRISLPKIKKKVPIIASKNKKNKGSISKLNSNNTSQIGGASMAESQIKENNAKFNFFQNIRTDQNKITRFMNQSQMLEKQKEDRVGRILDKSKFWEERLKSFLISDPMKQRLRQAKNAKSLVNLRTQLNEHTSKEMKILGRKNRDLVNDLNKVSNRIRLQKKEIQRLQSTLDNMRIPNNDEFQNFLKIKQEMINKTYLLREKVLNNQKFKERIERINSVCEINQIQNEEWIRRLTFYQTNLNKAIDIQSKNIEKIRTKERKLNDKVQQLIEMYNVRRVDHSSLIKDMEDELTRKKYLSQQIVNTDYLIMQSVNIKKKEINHQLINHMDKEAKQKELLSSQKQQKRMKDELDDLLELETRVSILFSKPTEEELENLPSNVPKEECEEWHNKPSMRKCIVEIERNRDLRQALMNRNDKLEAIKADNNVKVEILTTLKEANKSGTKDIYTDKEHIIKKNDLIKKKIVEEKSQIGKCNEFIQNSIDVTDNTKLIMSSIAKIIGSINQGKELKELNNKDQIINVSIILGLF